MSANPAPAKRKKTPLPRYWRVIIGDLTGLHFCDRDCDCGENNRLWWFPPGAASRAIPEWVPGWMNGAPTDEVWAWLVENGRALAARRQRGGGK